MYRASGALLAPLHLGQVNQSSSDCGAARGGRSVLLLRCRGSAGSACVSISLMRGAHAVRAPARSASSVMLARRGPCMSCGDAERRAARVLEWTTPRLRTGAMNLSGRTPTHTRCWVCGGVPLQVRSAARVMSCAARRVAGAGPVGPGVCGGARRGGAAYLGVALRRRGGG